MKMNQEAIVLGLAAVAVYFIMQSKKTPTKSVGGLTSTSKGTTEIFDANNGGGAFANGWRYFSDGTAIDPSGNYYQGGQLIWQNTTSPKWLT